jgi:hypothetical protein
MLSVAMAKLDFFELFVILHISFKELLQKAQKSPA